MKISHIQQSQSTSRLQFIFGAFGNTLRELGFYPKSVAFLQSKAHEEMAHFGQLIPLFFKA